MASAMKSSFACVSFLLFSPALAWEWPFLSARTPTPEPPSGVMYGACSNNGALVCNGPGLFGLCQYGSVVYQSVADGAVCEDGNIISKEDAAKSCSKDGVLVCHGSRMFGICRFGKVVYQPVEEGTWCEDGQIVGTGSPSHASYSSGVHQSVVPHSSIPCSTVPHSTIQHSTIPTKTIRHSTIPTKIIEHSTIPTKIIQHSTIPTRIIQHSTIPTSTAQHSYIPKPAHPVEQISDGQVQAYHKRDERQVIANPVAKPLANMKRSNADESPSAYPGGGPTATIDAGIVHGTTTSLPAATATVNKYLGIPFAASPPVRFSPPQRPHSWNTPINATAYKPACIQQFMYPEVASNFVRSIFNSPTPAESEDCLYLNVFAPSSPASSEGRSVLFWIYGGSLEFGNAGNPIYDGSLLAAYQDVIVVTVNYRTNVFGFASSPELPLDKQNLGFLDQRMGLDWVQRNIHAFGGNPKKVTLFGESAGGFSIDALLTSYGKHSRPPFRGAILQSGQISYNPRNGPSSAPAWLQLSEAFGCPGRFDSNITCLRNASATDIQSYINKNSLKFNFARDNVTAVSDPAQRRLRGEIARIPVLVGSNAQEGRVFQVGQNSAEATRAFVDELSGNVTAYGDLIEAAYPLGSPGINTYYDQVSQIFTEYAFQCTAALFTNDSASVGIPAWRYYFNASFANTQAFPNLGVYHASEIPLVFGTYPRTNITTQEYALSTTIMGMWSRFAKNPMGGPGWNPVRSGAASTVLVGAEDVGMGGTYIDEYGMSVEGSYNLAVLGNRRNELSSGVTVIDQREVDYRCGIFQPTYQAVMALDRGF